MDVPGRMGPSADPFLTAHTGSLPRPPELTKALERHDHGEQIEDLDRQIREAVIDVVRRQVEAGVAVRQRRRGQQDRLLDVRQVVGFET